jgi:hypothetical protein
MRRPAVNRTLGQGEDGVAIVKKCSDFVQSSLLITMRSTISRPAPLGIWMGITIAAPFDSTPSACDGAAG